jgi:HEPN domain-containing protein
MPEVAICRCQQAAEKALMGFLFYWDCRIENTRHLGSLLEKAAEIEPCFGTWAEAADHLTLYATEYCDPGTFLEPDEEELDEAPDDAACIVNQVLSWLPAEVHPASAVRGILNQ